MWQRAQHCVRQTLYNTQYTGKFFQLLNNFLNIGVTTQHMGKFTHNMGKFTQLLHILCNDCLNTRHG